MNRKERQRQREKVRFANNKEEILKRLQDYRLKHPQQTRDNARKRQLKYRRKLRILVLEKLGNKCVRCDIADKRVLQVDHIKAKNVQDRDRPQYNPRAFNKHILEDSSPYQLLCANCNWIKRWVNHEVR
jgi:hypothetical protein